MLARGVVAVTAINRQRRSVPVPLPAVGVEDPHRVRFIGGEAKIIDSPTAIELAGYAKRFAIAAQQ